MTEQPAKSPGRPQKEIDWELVDIYLEAGSTGTEIAAYFNMHYETFYDRVKQKYNMLFTQYAGQKQQKGNIPLRVAQYNKALEGDNTQLIWLGKNRLGQSESPQEVSIDKETMTHFTNLMSQLSSAQSASKNERINNSNESQS